MAILLNKPHHFQQLLLQQIWVAYLVINRLCLINKEISLNRHYLEALYHNQIYFLISQCQINQCNLQEFLVNINQYQIFFKIMIVIWQ